MSDRSRPRLPVRRGAHARRAPRANLWLAQVDLGDDAVGDGDSGRTVATVGPDHIIAGLQAAEDGGQDSAGPGPAIVHPRVHAPPVLSGAADLDLPTAVAVTGVDDQRPPPGADVERDAGAGAGGDRRSGVVFGTRHRRPPHTNASGAV